MVIEETLLGQGQLNEVGLRNLESLRLQFHAIPFEVRSTDLALSRSKPLPQLDTFCFLCAEMEQEQSAAQEESEFSLEQYRVYLILCRALVHQLELNSEKVTNARSAWTSSSCSCERRISSSTSSRIICAVCSTALF